MNLSVMVHLSLCTISVTFLWCRTVMPDIKYFTCCIRSPTFVRRKKKGSRSWWLNQHNTPRCQSVLTKWIKRSNSIMGSMVSPSYSSHITAGGFSCAQRVSVDFCSLRICGECRGGSKSVVAQRGFLLPPPLVLSCFLFDRFLSWPPVRSFSVLHPCSILHHWLSNGATLASLYVLYFA